jgi:hypothetical protein
MQIENTAVETFSIGAKETSVARIQASAKAFEILSSGLYSNAPLAIIRELCANAKDSHIAAGKLDVAFDVQIPNELSPQFSVRDFGVGMTHEFVMTRVNTYFDSTKAESNDEIGGFGLGIKSVFSYTTSFMIACYDGSTRRVYTYAIGSGGMPEISFLASTPSTEPQGVEVIVPVKDADFRTFQKNCIEALTFYSPRPNITGIEEDRFELKKLYGGTAWSIYTNPGILAASTYVKMGDVIYPVAQEANRYDRGYNTAVVVFEVGIGGIDITPNREQLKGTPRTKETLERFEEQVKKELLGQMQDYINSFTCPFWDLYTQEGIRDLFRSSIATRFNISVDKMTYRGIKLNNHLQVNYSPKNANPDLVKKIKNASTVVHYYGDLDYYKFKFDEYTNIQISPQRSSPILVGPIGFSDQLTMNKMTALYPDFQTRSHSSTVYVLEIEDKLIDDLIKDINANIPDYENRVTNFNDVKSKLDGVKEPNQYVVYECDSSKRYNSNDAIEFDIATFEQGKTVYFEQQGLVTTGRNRDRFNNKVTDVFYYMSEETAEKLKSLGIEKVYLLSVEQQDALKNAGFTLATFTETCKVLLDTIAQDFANLRPTMSLAEFLKPITEKNRRICLSTHYKAVKRWVNESGDADLLATLRQLNDASSSSYRESADDKLFRAVAGKSIKQYIADNNIVPTKVTTNQVIQDIVTKAPLAARLVSDYTDKDVVDYVHAAMGWTKPAPVAKPKRKRPSRAKAATQPTMAAVDPITLQIISIPTV